MSWEQVSPKKKEKINRDMVRLANQVQKRKHHVIGLLMMNKGVYNKKRIISEKYVNLATSIQQMNREGGYGYYFWKYRDGFSINGKWKQKCYCLPNQKIMVTYLCHIEDESHDLLMSMEKNILGID